MSIQLSNQQQEVVDRIYSFDWKKPFFLGGYGGTGKSTLLRTLAEDQSQSYMFLAPTNKAAQVLKSKLPPYAHVSTIHSVLYSPVSITPEYKKQLQVLIDEGGEFATYAFNKLQEIEDSNIEVDFLQKAVDLKGLIVVVDEASMVRSQEFDLLVQHAEKIVFVGDPFQLPPVKSAMKFPTKMEDFDGFLTEVHRAALESPITRLAMEIREDNFSGWNYWKDNGINIHANATVELLNSVEQVICGTHKTRWAINRAVRKAKGLEDYKPCVDDKVIIRENIRVGKGEIYACNGDIGVVDKLYNNFNKQMFELTLFNGRKKYIAPHYNLFAENYGVENKEVPKLIGTGAYRNYGVDYAYAITVHSSQGSEWDSVMFFDDGMLKNNPTDRRRFMYTAITRAKNNLVIVKKQ